MKLLLSWAREFVPVAATAKQIADTMALRGFEVAAIEHLGDDAVIDFDITANRPDCLSVAGLAREIATAFDLPFTPRPHAPLPVGEQADLRVSIADADLCPRYAAAVADVTPAASPAWLTARLQACGIRSISALVDITNYVLLELGHPMHAFDLEKLDGREIRVRRANAGETLITLDGLTRSLQPDMLTIADASHAQAVAGVMGGAASEVSSSTRVVAFESAYFKPASIRRTSKRLGLKTEASARFERGADINAPLVALARAVQLLEQIGAGQRRGPAVDAYPRPLGDTRLHLRRERLARVLGLAIPDADVLRILAALGLSPALAADGWNVQVPTRRVDLVREVDLIEEVGRHFGFDRLEAAFPEMRQAAGAPDARVTRDALVRRVLAAAGFDEAVTFGFVERSAAEGFVADSDASSIVPVANPLSAKFDVLRPSLLPGLLESLAHNRRHGRRDVGLYETGARFTTTSGERRAVALACTGATAEHWSSPTRPVDFFDVKGVVENLCSALNVSPTFSADTCAYLVPGQCARVSILGEPVGVLGQVTPGLMERAGAPRQDAVFVAELDLDGIEALRRTATEQIAALPRHPSVVRDLSVIVPDALPADTIRGTIQTAAGKQPAPLLSLLFFDRYQGKGVPDGSVSISVRLTFQAPDRTLTDQEVQTTFDTILSALVREHGAVQR